MTEEVVTSAPQTGQNLAVFLSLHAPAPLAGVLQAIADAALPLAHLIRRGRLAGEFESAVGPAHDGVAQAALDVFADDAFVNGLRCASVRAVVSQERDRPVPHNADGAFLVAIDPLDGSTNIDVNVTVGTIFSVLDAPTPDLGAAQFLQLGVNQRAAGLLLYGPQVAFVFTVGSGVHMATLDPDANAFRMTRIDVRVPAGSDEFAINASNARYWPAAVRAYFDDCLEGDEGPRRRNFNMRWVGSVAADVCRILVRGGVYLYPEDSREGYGKGRLRVLYEANPIALLIEQAGGAAIDGFRRVLDVKPTSLHMRTPLIFGSKDKVERIARYYSEGAAAMRAPLFGKRGLLRR
jgi:fructose-1,6-bisphosphatase I